MLGTGAGVQSARYWCRSTSVLGTGAGVQSAKY